MAALPLDRLAASLAGEVSTDTLARTIYSTDGSEVTFGPLSAAAFAEKCGGPDTLETRIYRTVRDLLGDEANRRLVRESFPRPEVTRRNTGYALDAVMDASSLDPASGREFNMCRLLAGSEGTLFVGVEFEHADRGRVEKALADLEADLRAAGLGYAYPALFGPNGDKVWELRRAGQGLVNNVPGDAKPREIVEDTAVAVEDLPAYIAEFDRLLAEKYGIDCVHYAHAGAGELHLRPLFDLRSAAGLKMFRAVATDVAALVKKYRGSLSGEHGDEG